MLNELLRAIVHRLPHPSEAHRDEMLAQVDAAVPPPADDADAPADAPADGAPAAATSATKAK